MTVGVAEVTPRSQRFAGNVGLDFIRSGEYLIRLDTGSEIVTVRHQPEPVLLWTPAGVVEAP